MIAKVVEQRNQVLAVHFSYFLYLLSFINEVHYIISLKGGGEQSEDETSHYSYKYLEFAYELVIVNEP